MGAPLALLGNAPSTGSTLLADLLDSTPRTFCGPETNLFANRYLYSDLDRLRRDPHQRSGCSCLYTKYVRTYFEPLKDYGLDEEALQDLLRKASTPRDVMTGFVRAARAHHHLPTDAQVFEKTPQNISCVGQFLRASPGWFICMVRHPIAVYCSLRRRDFSPLRAAGAWLFDIARYLVFRRHPRVITVRYEDLVREPYETTARVLSTVTGESFGVGELERAHRANTHRTERGARALESWRAKDTKKIVQLPHDFEPEYVQELASFLGFRVSPLYAVRWGLRPITYGNAIKKLGYEDAFRQLADVAPQAAYAPNPEELIFLRQAHRIHKEKENLSRFERWEATTPLWG